MEEQLISFETAKLAKEKSFNPKVELYYSKNTKTYSITYGDYPAVSQSVLQLWLREKYDIHLSIEFSGDHKKYAVGGFDENLNKKLDIRPRINNLPEHKCNFIRKVWKYKSYENALEFGLQEALKLIK